MAKYYEVKVYNQTGTYVTTWKDVVSNIQFNNEINSAGGQLKLTLARNAGDYGEGTDVSFGYKVRVYCFDNETPNGDCIFQGYISAYTPIYKDDKVEVTALGFGSELNDYIVEAGDTAYVSQTSANKTYNIGATPGLAEYYYVIQTIQLAATKNINSIDIQATTTQAGTIYVSLYQYSGTPDAGTSTDIASGSVDVGISTQQTYKVTFAAPANLSSSNTYFILISFSGTYGNCKIHASSSNPYASGTVWTQSFFATSWNAAVQVSSDDLYFVLYEYGGNTTAVFSSEEPTAILTELVENYNSRGGHLTVPQTPYTPKIKQEYKGSSLPSAYWGNAYAQTFTPSSTFTLTALQLYLGVSSGSTTFVCQVYQGDPSGDLLTVISGTESYGTSATFKGVSDSIAVTNTALANKTFTFSTPITLNAGTQYFFLFEFGQSQFGNLLFRAASTGDPYNTDTQVGKLYYANATINNASFGMGYSASTPAIYFKAYDVTPIPASFDGGYDSTGTTVSYTFKVQTLYEATNVLKDLAPENWYWYVEQGTNELKFQEKSEEPEHIFSLEKDIIDAKFEKRTEDIVNTLYFTGGDTGGGSNFYKKYYNTDSIAQYGVKSAKYTDTRVTTTATADTIGNNIIATKSQPELRVNLTILDSNNNQGVGYDIETLKVGDVIAVRNITQQVGLSTWDVGRWDEAYWDYNIYNLSSLRMQIQKIDYNEDTATVYASTIPIDVNKRVEQINRNLEALQTLNNPTTPS